MATPITISQQAARRTDLASGIAGGAVVAGRPPSAVGWLAQVAGWLPPAAGWLPPPGGPPRPTGGRGPPPPPPPRPPPPTGPGTCTASRRWPAGAARGERPPAVRPGDPGTGGKRG